MMFDSTDQQTKNDHKRLIEVLCQRDGVLQIALSGGIDSITLMTVAARARQQPTRAVHAISAAVPAEATLRCRDLADQYNWSLLEVDAGEFEDENYLRNPLNRCYYCKSSLFDRMLDDKTMRDSFLINETDVGDIGKIKTDSAKNHVVTLATGTNIDDLGDYRPGLIAARERGVWQPYVEAGIDKNAIRRIAKAEGLGDLAKLPAQPCLSSRVETGIAINARDLGFIHRVENAILQMTEAGDIRCRITHQGVAVQLPSENGIFNDKQLKQTATTLLNNLCKEEDRTFSGFSEYRMGSAFLKPTTSLSDNV